MSDEPLPNRPNGRDDRGRFAKGNPGGPGNPMAGKVTRLRTALLEAVGPGDVRRVTKKLVDLATEGDIHAARLLLERVLGPAVAIDIEARVEALETLLTDTEVVT